MTELKNITLRDYFAAHAMQGLIASDNCTNCDLKGSGAGDLGVADDIARRAYVVADAMLKHSTDSLTGNGGYYEAT